MGKRVWFPVVSGAVGAVRGGLRGVVAVSGVFIVGDGEQAVPVRSAEPLA